MRKSVDGIISFKSVVAPILLSFLIIIGGALGYVYFEHMSFLDAIYATIVTLTPATPVSKTPQGELFSVFLVFFGLSFVIYIIGRVGSLFIEGHLRKILGRRVMETRLQKVSEHYILCGFGRIGSQVYKNLQRNNITVVVVENNYNITQKLEQKEILHVYGEATEEEILLKAGIKRAKGLIAAVGSDADNVYIVLVARDLNPNLYILARATDTKAAKRLKQAGADRVISSYEIGAKRLAESITHPLTTDFMELTLSGHGELQIREMIVGYLEKPFTISDLKKEANVLTIVLRRKNNETIFNPSLETPLSAGDSIAVLGKQADLSKLEKMLGAVPFCLLNSNQIS